MYEVKIIGGKVLYFGKEKRPALVATVTAMNSNTGITVKKDGIDWDMRSDKKATKDIIKMLAMN